jgi:hypothetical protein
VEQSTSIEINRILLVVFGIHNRILGPNVPIWQLHTRSASLLRMQSTAPSEAPSSWQGITYGETILLDALNRLVPLLLDR